MGAETRMRLLSVGGAAGVVAATFLPWGLRDLFVSYLGTSSPANAGEQTAWQAFPVIAGLLVVAALLAAATYVIPLGSERQRILLGASEAAFVLILALACWISPPRGAEAGLGQILATAGALLLLSASAGPALGPLRHLRRGPWRDGGASA